MKDSVSMLLRRLIASAAIVLLLAAPITIPTVTQDQLSALPSYQYALVQRVGIGDAQFFASSNGTPCTISGGDVGSQVPAAPSEGGCWLGQFPASGIGAAQFGAKGDNTTDNAASLQAWLNYGAAQAALHGARLTIGAGQYLTSKPLAAAQNLSNLAISGAGKGATQIVYTGSSTTTDIIELGTPSASSIPLTLQDFTILSNTTMTGGDALHLRNVGDLKMTGVDIDTQWGNHKVWNGLVCEACFVASIQGYDLAAQNDVVEEFGNASFIGGTRSNDIFFLQGKISNGTIGVHIGGGACGMNFQGGNSIINNQTNMVYDNTLSSQPNCQLHLGPGSALDTPAIDNLVVNQTVPCAGGCQIMLGGWIASAGQYGVHVKTCAGCQVLVMDGPIIGNKKGGLLFDDNTASVSIDGEIYMNGSTSGYGVDCAGTSPVFQARNASRIYLNGPAQNQQVNPACAAPLN